jgi:hypothetical protein
MSQISLGLQDVSLCILFDSEGFDWVSRISTQDGMGSSSRLVAGFVDSAIGAAADETHYIVVIVDTPLTCISHRRHFWVGRLCECKC